MPKYEYQCLKCERIFEISQKITDPPIKKCAFDKCGGKVRRLISTGAGVIFKGSGFYATDYKKTREPAQSEAKTCPAAAGSSCPNAGSCPAAKD